MDWHARPRGGIRLASNAAVLFASKFGQIVWPEGLPARSQNAFRLASGGEGVGLTNTSRRLDLLLGGLAALGWENTNGWVRVRISLPLTPITSQQSPHALPDPR